MEAAKFSIWRYRFAVLTALSTFPLIFMGGLVTSKDAGMEVPDWPSSFNYNMFTFPIHRWTGGIFYEHGHRLLGSLVGFLTLTLAFWVAFAESRTWLRRLTWGALAAVIVQGLLGGLRVRIVEVVDWGSFAVVFSIIHGCFAQAFLVLICFVAYFNSREWAKGKLLIPLANKPEGSAQAQIARMASLRKMALFAVAIVYLQLTLGALVRHANQGVYFHAAFAIVVVTTVLTTLIKARRFLGKLLIVRELTTWLATLLIAQVSLGVLSWMALPQVGYFQSLQFFRELTPTMHQITGALILLASAFLVLRLFRIELNSVSDVSPTEQYRETEQRQLVATESA